MDRAYYGRLLATPGSEYFKPFRVADRPYPDLLRKAAGMILRVLAHSSDPVTLGELQAQPGLAPELREAGVLEDLMTCLEEDYDLARQDDGWCMRSKVLADRWRLLPLPRQGG